jgi:hypothetical protein
MYNTDSFAQKAQNDILFFGEVFKIVNSWTIHIYKIGKMN